ncbi:MAG TPA: MFS transporter [Jatrophihabitans sp.]|jgi:MFS family permease|uniref:MFS transporter n=1 Tax=Jatrophihabitans sp. TaxID=1932789 RepID=UPI002EFD1CB7
MTSRIGTPAQRWSAVLLIAGFVGVTYGFGIYVFSQLLPTMSDDLGFSYATAGQITGIGQLLFIVFAFAATWLSHRFNGAVVVVGSAALCTLCLIGVGLTSSTVVLTICLAIAAGTSASVYVPIVEMVPRLIEGNRRGTALGIISSGTTYGIFVSAAVIPVLTDTVGWRAVWFVVAGVSVALIVVAVRLFSRLGLFQDLPDPAAEDAAAGSAGVSGGAADRPRARRSLAAGLAFISVWMVGIWVIKFMNGFSFMSYQNFLAPLLRDHGGQTIGYSSAVWMTIAVVGAFAGFAVGRLGDVLGLRRTLTICYGLFLASCLLLYTSQSGWLPFVAAMLFGLSFYPIYGLVPAYVGKISTVSQATLIFGLANVFQGAGGVVGNLTGGSVATDTAWLPNYYLLLGAGAFVLAAATLALPSDRATRRADAATGSGTDTSREAVEAH